MNSYTLSYDVNDGKLDSLFSLIPMPFKLTALVYLTTLYKMVLLVVLYSYILLHFSFLITT